METPDIAVRKIGVDESIKKKATCKNCGSILEFFPKSIKSKLLYSFGESESYRFVICPECECEVSVK